MKKTVVEMIGLGFIGLAGYYFGYAHCAHKTNKALKEIRDDLVKGLDEIGIEVPEKFRS